MVNDHKKAQNSEDKEYLKCEAEKQMQQGCNDNPANR